MTIVQDAMKPSSFKSSLVKEYPWAYSSINAPDESQETTELVEIEQEVKNKKANVVIFPELFAKVKI